MTVLLLTRSDDHYVPDIVASAVRQHGGGDVIRIDTDAYPDDIAVSDGVDDVVLRVGDRRFRGDEVRAAWCRRLWAGSRVGCASEYVGWASSQAQAAFAGFVRALGDRAVNELDAEGRAEDKGLQLRLARRLGFVVPETIISNDADVVGAFVSDAWRQGRRVITKLLRPLSQTMRGDGAFMFTSTVEAADVAHLSGLRYAPQIFQHRVERAWDLRVQVMGDVVVAGATAGVGDDWRRDGDGQFRPWPLSPPLAERCRRLCRALGLVTGAIDLVVAAGHADAGDDGVFFLEINPGGEWGMLERDLGPGLADALARALLADRHGGGVG